MTSCVYFRRMTLGKIDSLGQFVSHFDPDPESTGTVKKKPTGSSRFFRSKKDKEKVCMRDDHFYIVVL